MHNNFVYSISFPIQRLLSTWSYCNSTIIQSQKENYVQKGHCKLQMLGQVVIVKVIS